MVIACVYKLKPFSTQRVEASWRWLAARARSRNRAASCEAQMLA